MRKLLSYVADFRSTIISILILIPIIAVLIYNFSYPEFSADHIERYEVRLSQVVEMTRNGMLTVTETKGFEFMGTEYTHEVKLPLLFWNLSHKGTAYVSREENVMKVAFICSVTGQGKPDKVICYSDKPIHDQPLAEKIPINWSLDQSQPE